MSEILDLDALAPKPATIKFNGSEIQVNAPKTSDLLRLGSLGKKLEDVEELSESELDGLVDELSAVVTKIIPELASANLNSRQLLGLVKLISDMAIPPESKELEEQGITPVGGKADPKDQ